MTLYKIEKEKLDINMAMNKVPQPVSYTLSNMVAIFEEYFTSFFDTGYFKTVKMRTEPDFGTTVKNMVKIKEKPMLLIDPSDISISESSAFYFRGMRQWNNADPRVNLTADFYNSDVFYRDDNCLLAYRGNRYLIKFDLMMAVSTFAQQIDLYNHLIMRLRHQSKFSIERNILVRLPSSHIQNLANLHGLSYKSAEFLTLLNSNSLYPIIKRSYASGHLLFFMIYPTTIAVEVPDIPSKDGYNRNGMAEGTHRVTDIITFETEIPSEMMFVIADRPELNLIPCEVDPDDILYISPIVSSAPAIEIPGYKVSNRLDVMASVDDASLNIIDLVYSEYPQYEGVIELYKESGNVISDLVQVKCNVDNIPYEGFTFIDGVLTILEPNIRLIYDIIVHLNFSLINDLSIQTNTQKIGTLTL